MTKAEFNILFERLYSPLCNYAYKIVNDHQEAEDIVQGIFVDFWNKADQALIAAQVDNYLVRAVKFKCIDYQRHAIVKRKFEAEAVHTQTEVLNSEESEKTNLSDLLQIAIAQLPEKTREVFILCKQDGLSYKDIATQLNISPKTVENQMGRAFKHLREKLGNMKNLLAFILFNFGVGVFS
jgi:RNA polymerase sigma-70 factor (ECF subfamily)